MRKTRKIAQNFAVTCALLLFSSWAFGQKDSGVRGGVQNTGGGLQQQGIPIPHPPLISPNPATGATINDNELASFLEGILRAGQLESTCDTCADVTDGSPVTGLGELDPVFPQFHTNSNGLGARHNADQCFACHAQPVLGGSGGFIVPNPGDKTPHQAENPQFRLVPHRYGRQNAVPSFEQQFGPIREVRFKHKPDGTPDGGVHQLWTVRGGTNDPTIPNCALTQPDFEAEEKAGNLAFRIPLQMMGLGLIESIQDREILIPTVVATTAPSPVSDGRRRTNRSPFLLVRPTTSRWESATKLSQLRRKKTRIVKVQINRNRMTLCARTPPTPRTRRLTILSISCRIGTSFRS